MATLAIPDYTVKQADYARARNAALELLRRLDITHPAVNPVEVALSQGVQVRFVEFAGASDSVVSGYFDPEENAIVVNRHEFAPRQTFTVAHELGHKILHAEWADSDQYEVYFRDPKLASNTPIEQEANHFAATLLMPKFMMDEYYREPESRIAAIFAVSIPAVRARLQSLYGF